MRQRVLEYIRQKDMLREGDVAIVGLSGGADSLCLLLLMKELEEELRIRVRAVHVEHGIRGEESLADAEFVKALCADRHIPCTVFRADVPAEAARSHTGTEETARRLRYEYFRQEAKACGGGETGKVCVALAHHREDNAETMLFQMIRGSGLSGLCGMKPVRKEDELRYIRPLLAQSRADIEHYLRACGQEWRTDSTNLETEYARNRLRQEVFPVLSDINSQAVCHMNRLAEQAEQIRDYLQSRIREECRKRLTTQPGKNILRTDGWESLHPVIGDGLLREILVMTAGRQKDISHVHIGKIQELIGLQSGRTIILPHGVSVRREYETLVFFREEEETDGDGTKVPLEELMRCQRDSGGYEIFAEGLGTLSLRIFPFDGDFNKIEKKPYTKWFDYDMIKSSLFIRRRRPGDYFCIDADGHRKKLERVFIDDKIPKSRRDQIWLLAEGDRILWQIGGRLSSDVKISERTKTVLEIRLAECKGETSDPY